MDSWKEVERDTVLHVCVDWECEGLAICSIFWRCIFDFFAKFVLPSCVNAQCH